MELTLWHNPRCSKSRQTLALLEQNGHAPIIRLYLSDAPDDIALRAAAAALGGTAINMMRADDAAFKSLGISPTDDDALFAAMVENPALIERPILFAGPRAAIGRPPESVLDII